MNTPIQEAIEFYKLKLAEYPKKYNISQVDIAVHKSYMDIVTHLQSLLEMEQETFIQFGLDCQEEMYCDNNGDLKALGRPDTLFEQIFNGK